MPVALRLIDRIAIAVFAMTAGGAAIELWRTWPSGSAGAGFLLLLATQTVVFTATWAMPVGFGLGGLVLLVTRLWPLPRAPDTAAALRRRLAALVWVGPLLLLALTIGQALLAWSGKAFARQDLAHAIAPAALLAADVILVALAATAHRLLARWARLGRLRARVPTWAVAAIAGAGVVAATVVHLARFPALLDDPMVPALLLLAGLAALGATLLVTVRHVRWRLGTWPLIGFGGAVAGLFALLLFGGRVAPLSYPAAAAAVQTRGLITAVTARALARLGDGDGDGFSRWFGGLDCDDGDRAINPLAKDLPGNDIDEDCFEGDLTASAIEGDRAARQAQRRPAQRRIKNVVMITIDALRADGVGFGGAPRDSSPHLDALAARSVVFEKAYSAAPMTRRAFPALLASRYPSNIHWLDAHLRYTISHDDNQYAAETLAKAGIDTAMVVAFAYAKNGKFDQGFATRIEKPASKYPKEINGNVIVDEAVAILRKRFAKTESTASTATAPIGPAPAPAAAPPAAPTDDRGLFLWTHFYEAHYPYQKQPWSKSWDNTPKDRYLGEVRYIDEQIGRLLDELTRLGIADDTAIIVTADHGEEFGEHGGQWHGDLFPEDLHVPLLVFVPGGTPRRVSDTVSLVDVTPTVLDLFGVEPPDSFDGDSLLPLVDGEQRPPRPAFAELIPDSKVPRRLVTLIDGDWQLIADFALGGRELYDLANDPTAQHNLFVDAPAEAATMEQRLRRFLALRIGPLRVDRAKGAKPPAKKSTGDSDSGGSAEDDE